MKIQFYKVTYTVPTQSGGLVGHTIYEPGRANLMKAIGEILTAKGTFTVEPVATEGVPSYIRKELQEVR